MFNFLFILRIHLFTYHYFHFLEPSYNIQPGEIAPIIISANHFERAGGNDFMVIPALWGLIPRWHKGNYKEHGFNTTNFGLENMDTSRMYKPAYEQGQRCVLVCEGYYENQRVPYQLPPDERSIYFIHSKQAKGVKINDKNTWNWSTINLLYIAGIFDTWTDDDGSEIYNFTMLSMPSEDNILSWMHPRSPAILETKRQVFGWLDHHGYHAEEALSLIKELKMVEMFEVSDHVLNANNKGYRCNQPLYCDIDD